MILHNKKQLLFSSLLTLLPIPAGLLLWSRFPGDFSNHFVPTVFLPPVILLIGQWMCIFFTAMDSGNKNRNQKPQTMVLWIIPFLSCLTSGILYALLLGMDFSPTKWMIFGMGLLFAIIGNYLPKTRMNSTIGIKVSWAYSSEENWNATHHFSGKLWVAGGLVMALCAFLPERFAFGAMFVILVVLCALPLWYTWNFYRKELAQGRDVKAGYSATDKGILKISLTALAVLLVFLAVLLFSGDLAYRFEEESFTIEADWYPDLTVRYDAIEALAYHDGNVSATRVGGFGSFRLLMGWFESEELGIHTRYTYYRPKACVILTTENRAIVLSGANLEETWDLYQTLHRATGK